MEANWNSWHQTIVRGKFSNKFTLNCYFTRWSFSFHFCERMEILAQEPLRHLVCNLFAQVVGLSAHAGVSDISWERLDGREVICVRLAHDTFARCRHEQLRRLINDRRQTWQRMNRIIFADRDAEPDRIVTKKLGKRVETWGALGWRGCSYWRKVGSIDWWKRDALTGCVAEMENVCPARFLILRSRTSAWMRLSTFRRSRRRYAVSFERTYGLVRRVLFNKLGNSLAILTVHIRESLNYHNVPKKQYSNLDPGTFYTQFMDDCFDYHFW